MNKKKKKDDDLLFYSLLWLLTLGNIIVMIFVPEIYMSKGVWITGLGALICFTIDQIILQ